MCGIAGIISRKKDDSILDNAISMVGHLKHRGPDDSCHFYKNKVALAFRRLSIQDLSFDGRQPMTSDGCTLVFNGEIYNFKELRSELIELGHTFNSTSDSEVLLHSYLEWKTDLLAKVRGMFSFLIYDESRNRIFGARDLFGEKPLHYSFSEKEFVFASEIKSLKSYQNISQEVDYHSISYYLQKGYFKNGTTIYKNIQEIKPAHYFILNIDTWNLKSQPYSNRNLSLQKKSRFNFNEALDEFEDVFNKSIKERLIADVPIGLLLSSGVDSSLVGMYASKYSKEKLSAFTISHSGIDDESLIAKKIAGIFNLNHKVVKTNINNPESSFRNLYEIYDQPNGDPSSILTTEIFAASSDYHKVVLTGDVSDELFLGYKDILGYLIKSYLPYKGLKAGRKINYFLHNAYNTRSSILRNLSYFITAASFNSYHYEQAIYAKGWNQFKRKDLFYANSWFKTGADIHENHDKDKYNSMISNPLNYHFYQNMNRLSQSYLIKVDRASMASSVEARTPFLDPKLIEFVNKLSFNVLTHKTRKAIPKSLLNKGLPSSLISRNKLGFTPPLTMWLQDEKFHKWAYKLLTSENLIASELMPKESIDFIMENQNKGYDETARIWRLLSLNYWDSQERGISI